MESMIYVTFVEIAFIIIEESDATLYIFTDFFYSQSTLPLDFPIPPISPFLLRNQPITQGFPVLGGT